MRKRFRIILIAVLIFTQIFTNFIYADEATDFIDDNLVPESARKYSNPDNYGKAMNEGTTDTYEDGDEKVTTMPTAVSTVLTVLTYPLRILARVIMILPEVVNFILAKVIANGDSSFSIQETLINAYDMFNVKYLVEPDTVGTSETALDTLRNNVSVWFVIVRNISSVAIAIILIYIGMRMALATVAEEKAHYKEMIRGWFEGLILLFVLQFIIIFLVELSDWLVNVLVKYGINEDTVDVEQVILSKVNSGIFNIDTDGEWFFYFMVYMMLGFSQLAVFIFYMSRVIKTAFLIAISPLVCVTYSVDKLRDGKAQAFENWIREFVITVFAQPMQLLVYVIFVDSAGEILTQNMLLGVIFLALLPFASRIFKSILKFGDSAGGGNMDDARKAARGFGQNVGKGIGNMMG